MPYMGNVAFQLPTDAVQGTDHLAAHNGSGGINAGSVSPSTPQARAAAAAAAMGPGVRPSAVANDNVSGSWVWAQFSFLKDDQRAARACIAMGSISSATMFR